MFDLTDCVWTHTEVTAGEIVCTFWDEYPVMKYQKVQWFASGDEYMTEGYFN